MVRQAHTYMVGAMSGATLIAIAIAAFVLLVSAQVFQNWPVAALGGDSGGSAQVSPAQVAAPGVAAAAVHAASTAGPTAAGHAAAHHRRGVANPTSRGATAPEAGSPSQAAAPTGPGSSAPSQPQSSPASSPANSPSASPSSSEPSGSGGGGGNGGGGSHPGSPSGQVTETVNGTVNGVDETVLGGALHETGVTEATEGIVNGVAGPESTVGSVVDETVGALGGLVHGKH